MSTIGQRIEKHRLSKGLSRLELAKLASCTDRVIEYYEKDMHMPRLDIAIRVADSLGVSLDNLFRDGAGDEEERE